VSPRSDRALGAAIVAGPLAWAAQLTVAYAAEEGSCARTGHPGRLWGIELNVVLTGLSIICLAVVIGAGILCASHRATGTHPGDRIAELRRVAASVGIGTSALFALLICCGLIASTALTPC
jgi:hypothetical protein